MKRIRIPNTDIRAEQILLHQTLKPGQKFSGFNLFVKERKAVSWLVGDGDNVSLKSVTSNDSIFSITSSTTMMEQDLVSIDSDIDEGVFMAT